MVARKRLNITYIACLGLEHEYVKGSAPRGPDAPKPYKLALCAPCLIKGAPKHY